MMNDSQNEAANAQEASGKGDSFFVPGREDLLLTHCIALGLGNILANAGYRVKLLCQLCGERGDGYLVEAVSLSSGEALSRGEIGKIVLDFTENVFKKWPKDEEFGEEEEGSHPRFSPLSPNPVKGGLESQPGFYGEKRCSALDKVGDRLAQNLFVSLGRPSYWSKEQKEGVSGWFMFTAQRGDDFARCAYKPLCDAVKDLNAQQIEKSLFDGDVVKRVGDMEKPDVPSSHGLVGDGGNVDIVRLWCALHSFSCFPTRPVVCSKGFETPSNCIGYGSGYKGKGGERKKESYFYLPVFERLTCLERYKAVIRSRLFYEICLADEGDRFSSDFDALGLDCIYRFKKAKNEHKSSDNLTLFFAQSGEPVSRPW